MSARPINSALPDGLPLAFIVIGALALILGTTFQAVGGVQVWRWVIVAGAVVQFAGWVLYGRRMRGGRR
ncbi:hypothetical protein [Streptomyces sp. NPDC059639]|uniref:hypothetical protein n=1 Tax=Streptomyces sp. NPDC059639 TaxID=3346891 RepID=UPI0036A73689